MKWRLGGRAGRADGRDGRDGRAAGGTGGIDWPIARLIFDEQLADARITIYASDEFEGSNYNDANEKLDTWFTQEEEQHKKQRTERANRETASSSSSSSSSSIPRPPNQLVEVETLQSHWGRRIFPRTSLEEEFPKFIMELQANNSASEQRKPKGPRERKRKRPRTRKPPKRSTPKSNTARASEQPRKSACLCSGRAPWTPTHPTTPHRLDKPSHGCPGERWDEG